MIVRVASRGLGPVALVVLVGCGGASPAPAANPSAAASSASPPGEAQPDTEPPESSVEARATAPTEAEARATAVERLEVALYGSEKWAAFLDGSVHRAGTDPEHVVRADRAVQVMVGLDRDGVRARLEELPERVPDLEAPPQVQAAVTGALRAHLRRLSCERRRALLGDECTPPSTEEADAEMRTVALSILLEAKYDGGVPLDDSARPVRPATVVAQRVAEGGEGIEPVAGLLLRARPVDPSGDGRAGALVQERVRTDERGEASFPLEQGAPWSGALRIGVDSEAWLGPLARLWPTDPVRIEGRSTDLRRWAALVTERAQGSRSSDQVFEHAFAEALRERGARHDLSLTSDDRLRLQRASERDRLARVLPELAEELGGELDVLLDVDVDSEFASRMGTNRVWYEARGTVRALDAWSGRELETVQDSVTEAGLGDQRADRAARRALARTLADRLLQALEGAPES